VSGGGLSENKFPLKETDPQLIDEAAMNPERRLVSLIFLVEQPLPNENAQVYWSELLRSRPLTAAVAPIARAQKRLRRAVAQTANNPPAPSEKCAPRRKYRRRRGGNVEKERERGGQRAWSTRLDCRLVLFQFFV